MIFRPNYRMLCLSIICIFLLNSPALSFEVDLSPFHPQFLAEMGNGEILLSSLDDNTLLLLNSDGEVINKYTLPGINERVFQFAEIESLNKVIIFAGPDHRLESSGAMKIYIYDIPSRSIVHRFEYGYRVNEYCIKGDYLIFIDGGKFVYPEGYGRNLAAINCKDYTVTEIYEFCTEPYDMAIDNTGTKLFVLLAEESTIASFDITAGNPNDWFCNDDFILDNTSKLLRMCYSEYTDKIYIFDFIGKQFKVIGTSGLCLEHNKTMDRVLVSMRCYDFGDTMLAIGFGSEAEGGIGGLLQLSLDDYETTYHEAAFWPRYIEANGNGEIIWGMFKDYEEENNYCFTLDVNGVVNEILLADFHWISLSKLNQKKAFAANGEGGLVKTIEIP